MKRFNNVYMQEAGEGDDLGGAGDSGAGDGGEGGDGTGGGDTPIDFFGTAPEDWRDQALGKAGFEPGDEFDKAKKQLDRVSDFGVFTKNYLSAQEKIRSGEISNGLPENPTDEQMADYRLAHGVPETAADYQLSLDEGLVLGEADEAVMGSVYEVAHASNVSNETLSAMTNAMLQSRQAEADARVSQDGIDAQLTNQQLKEAWGGDDQANRNMITGLLNQLPESIKDPFMNARLPDGKAVFNSPEVMVAMAEWARKLNPAATVVPNSNNPMQSMNDEIKELESRMGTDEWYKDTEANNRLEALYNARNGMNAQ